MFVIEDKDLPYCNGRYRLSRFGDIIDINGTVIDAVVIDGVKSVFLEWIDGSKYYDLSVIIAIIKYSINIPSELWHYIEPLYFDENSSNTSIANVFYRFKEPPPVNGMPGFYYIPYYTKYAVNIDGSLYNLHQRKIHSWNIVKGDPNPSRNTKGGYMVTRALRDFAGKKHTSRHRIIGLAFIKYDKYPFGLVINHKDGIPGNDHPSNLEWVTHAQNNQHAYDLGLIDRSKKVLYLNTITGESKSFMSCMACSKYIGMTSSFVYSRLSANPNVLYNDGLRFKLDDGEPWPIITKHRKSSLPIAVMAKDIFTGMVYVFETATEASLTTGVGKGSIIYNCNARNCSALHGYNFRLMSEHVVWPKYTDRHLKYFKMFPKNNGETTIVIATDIHGYEVNHFESMDVAVKHFNIKKTTLISAIESNTPIDNLYLSKFKLNEIS
jgi:hypothetical protein